MNGVKPNVTAKETGRIVRNDRGMEAENIRAMEGGNLSTVFSFKAEEREYVIRFSAMEDDFQTESYVANLLASQGVPFPRVLGLGLHKAYSYCISERMAGHNLADLQAEQRAALLPELVQVITGMNGVKLDSSSSGYGFLNKEGNGIYASCEGFIRSFYGQEQQEGFWENWYELFTSSCLEKDVFDECYARLLAYSKYNAPHRHFVHNDCHEWNILTDGRRITGIIDSNSIYGDFMIDVASMHAMIPGVDMSQVFLRHYEELGTPVAHFEERLTGAHYFKGLDAMRFYAKMGWDHAYMETRDRLLSMPCNI
ncbi:aminoglycoside phosphotransferase family protein [Paenibacillus sp. FSL L8-0470]|uniref:phosphotransferase family protein n=1 Tax=Paenibacillus sp. FSL L8-0470 TaxID=2954688 RepID=UPI0030F64EF9